MKCWYFGDEISLLGEMVLNSQWPLLLRPPFYLDRIKYLFSSSNNDYEYLSCRLIRLGLLLISFSLEVLDIANSNSFRPTETHPPRYSFIANYPFYFAAYPWFIAWNKESWCVDTKLMMNNSIVAQIKAAQCAENRRFSTVVSKSILAKFRLKLVQESRSQ